jgi:alginate O-acetyltransferase complex protein AlgI
VSAYRPHDWHTIAAVPAMLAAVLGLGLWATRLPAKTGRLLAWIFVIAAAAGGERLTADEPAGVRMIAISVGLLFALKVVVTVEAQAERMPRLAAWKWLLFAGLSVGMRPEAFRTAGGPARPGVGRLLVRAVGSTAAGLGLLWVARNMRTTDDSSFDTLASAALLAGVGLILHYGILTALAAGWRLYGVPAEELHRRPTASRSLTEFWGRRWNRPFSELTARAVYRPLRQRVGDAAAVFIAFAFSGVLHELAISVPVRAGFGGPLAYFLLHGGLVLAERRLQPERWGVAGRAWTAAWLIIPLPFLFHPAFLRAVVWPLAF